MKSLFLIFSKKYFLDKTPERFEHVYDGGWFHLYSKYPQSVYRSSVTILKDGYILPRNSLLKEYQNQEQLEIILDLYKKHGDEFITYIKGLFTIIIIGEGFIKIYTDHLGINKAFYYIKNNRFCVSNDYQLLTSITGFKKLNREILAVKALLNREIDGKTLISDIHYTTPATQMLITNDSVKVSTYWKVNSLTRQKKLPLDYEFFHDLLNQNITNYNLSLRADANAITLTGGKDSRTALAALLSLGIRPTGFTYGNPKTIDAVYARKLATKAEIEHLIVNPEKTVDWFQETALEIVNLNNPLINIHRSHRLHAFNKIRDILGTNTSFYTGYMGGELLMGVFFDNLIFTNFIKDFWQNGYVQFETIPDLLSRNFLRQESIDIEYVKEEIKKLNSFDLQRDRKNMQFNSLFEIGVMHHSQDIQISQGLLDYPIPFFLDFDFVESLFRSNFSFLSKNVETKNLLKRHSLFEFNLTMQHLFYPKLDSVNFAKKGTYNTSEFLNGPYYWSFLKATRYFLRRKKYPSTFSYNENYTTFLVNNLNEIILDRSSPINDVYDVPLALSSLMQQTTLCTEGPIHKYSNIVMHYMQYNKFTTESPSI